MTHSDTRGEGKAVLSPCTGVCVLDVAGEYCVGCLRTVAEIGAWTRLSDSERERVVGKLEKRAREMVVPQRAHDEQ